MTGVGAVMGRMIGRASEPVVSLAEGYSVFAASLASFSLTSGGFVSSTNNPDETWIAPRTGMANYQVRASLLFGELSSGTTDTWLALGTTRTWQIQAPVGGEAAGLSEAQLLIEIRRTSDGAVLASTQVYLSVSG